MKCIHKSRVTHFFWQAALLICFLQLSGCVPPEETPAIPNPTPMDIDTLLQRGEDLYNQSCATCHYDGSGGGVNPSLISSEIVKGPSRELLQVIIHGQQGQSLVNGKKLNGIMPAQSGLNDVEVAAVATYVRRTFGQVEKAVQPADVARVRQK
jgi:mono/diheme cytochrome c family protein